MPSSDSAAAVRWMSPKLPPCWPPRAPTRWNISEVIGAGRPIERPGLPCVAVPTTAGTGSEVTRNSVLSGGGVKASLRSPLMLPKVAVVDPDLLVGLPGADHRRQRDGCAVPAHRAPPVAARQSRSAMRWPGTGSAAPPDHCAGRARREWRTRRFAKTLRSPACSAGMCLANSGLGAVHGIAAAAGARLSAPHGAVCAAVLAAAMEVNLRALRERAPEHPALLRMAEVAALAHRPARRNP